MSDLLQLVPLGGEAAFPKEEFDRRVGVLKGILAEKGFDLYATSGAENIFYLSGQQTPGYYTFQCLCVPAAGDPFMLIRDLERYNARSNSYIEDFQGYGDGISPGEALGKLLEERGWKGKRVAVDRNAWFLTVNINKQIEAALGETEDGSMLVEPLRRVKSPLEIESMWASAKANDAGMLAGIAATEAGVSENDVAAAIMGAAIAAGSEYLGMEPFVTSGWRSGLPHSTWRRRTIEPGDLVALETAASYNRYHAALFRTVAVGGVDAEARRRYDACLEALAAAIETCRPGNTCAQVHNAAQAVIDKHDLTAGYRKRTGYSLGISFAPDWGEGNIMSLNHDVHLDLVPGMIFHIPITHRDYAKSTVAVSETVLVTDGGNATMSEIPRDLVEA